MVLSSSCCCQSRDMGGTLTPPGLLPSVMGYSRISRCENEVDGFILGVVVLLVDVSCRLLLEVWGE